jgi:hypothetical protein
MREIRLHAPVRKLFGALSLLVVCLSSGCRGEYAAPVPEGPAIPLPLAPTGTTAPPTGGMGAGRTGDICERQ